VWPWLGWLTRSPYIRGAISGLGALNLIAGFLDLLSLFRHRRT